MSEVAEIGAKSGRVVVATPYLANRVHTLRICSRLRINWAHLRKSSMQMLAPDLFPASKVMETDVETPSSSLKDKFPVKADLIVTANNKQTTPYKKHNSDSGLIVVPRDNTFCCTQHGTSGRQKRSARDRFRGSSGKYRC